MPASTHHLQDTIGCHYQYVCLEFECCPSFHFQFSFYSPFYHFLSIYSSIYNLLCVANTPKMLCHSICNLILQYQYLNMVKFLGKL